jgi:hypothetical protein
VLVVTDVIATVNRGATSGVVSASSRRWRLQPLLLPTGIDPVFVSGVHVLEGGRYDAGARAGRVLRG